MEKYKIYTLILLVLTCFSCKEYLDVKPKGQVIPKTAEEFRALLDFHVNKVEGALENRVIGDASSVFNLEAFGDNLDAKLTFYPQGGALPVYVGDALYGTDFGLADGYEYLYACIRDCNIIIDNLDGKDSELGKNVTGAAYCLRSVCYYNLLRCFCEPYDKKCAAELLGLPIVDRFDMEERPTRSSWLETAAFIEKGFLYAIACNVKDEVWMFNVDVAKAFLAKLYFWSQQWDKALPLAKELLDNYPLIDGQAYVDMIQSKNVKRGNMIIRSYTVGGQSVSDMTYGLRMIDCTLRPVSKEFVASFAEAKRDIRYDLSFNKQRLSCKNLCASVRGAEMCLMLAECYAHENDVTNALAHVNALRSKRIPGVLPYTRDNLPSAKSDDLIQVDATGASVTPLMRVILTERRKELFMEGDRWFELKRNGRPEFWGCYNGRKLVTSKYLYTAPLPRRDVALVPGLIQNEGYVN